MVYSWGLTYLSESLIIKTYFIAFYISVLGPTFLFHTSYLLKNKSWPVLYLSYPYYFFPSNEIG